MSKLEKKRDKILERIKNLEDELRMSLTKKDSATSEINVGEYNRKIMEAKMQLIALS